jgi:hypothetical protein
MEGKRLCDIWQELLARFGGAFTAPGWRRFAAWVTGLALNVEEHTVTQSLIALDRPGDWKALETFVETGHWVELRVQGALTRLVDEAPGRLWYGYHVEAYDDTKVHRTSPGVWGTCTFHEYTARCPNRAATVRAHNWVVGGALLHNPSGPAWFVPLAGRLYCRKGQCPDGVPFRTKCELLVEMARWQARATPGPHLAVYDGAFAVASVVRPLASRRSEALTPSIPDSGLGQDSPVHACRTCTAWLSSAVAVATPGAGCTGTAAGGRPHGTSPCPLTLLRPTRSRLT